MAAVVGSIIYIVLGIICAFGLLSYLNFDKKVKCKTCSTVIHSSQIKCKNCGAIVDRKIKTGLKMAKKVNRREELKFEDGLKSLKRE
jgi:Fe2+ or Zn2+ uptake regulation protein